jgi:single-strand DNA-binding protein
MPTRTARTAPPEAAPGPTHVNTVCLLGRLAADPEPRDLPSGDLLLTFRVVVDRPDSVPGQRRSEGGATSRVEVEVTKARREARREARRARQG